MSESVGSKLSRRSGSYRTISSKSSVDENLFASHHPDSTSKLQRERHRNLRSKNGRGTGDFNETKKATVIPREHFDAIRARSVITLQEEKRRLRKNKEQESQEKRKVALARKERMLKLEEERKNKKHLTAEELEDEEKVSATLEKAANIETEQIDQVKTMRRMMVYAQCAKIREQQIKEKGKIKQKHKNFEERQDLMMEVDRLKSLKQSEAEERERNLRRKNDASQIRVQIEERQRMKILEEELLEQEKQQMKVTIKEQELEEARQRKLKHAEGKKLLAEVLEANKKAIDAKKDRVQREREDDERILKWQEEKRLQEEAHEQEKIRIQQEKEREFWNVFSTMKKSQDNRSAQDALRAKRHQQEELRKQREKERKLKAKAKASLEELQRARVEQEKRKIKNLKLLAIQDKEEWEKIRRENTIIQQRHDEVIEAQQEQNLRHQKALRQQMIKRLEDKRCELEAKRREGEDVQIQNKRFLKKIQKKKEEILSEMRDGGIPEKFCAEVARVPVSLQ